MVGSLATAATTGALLAFGRRLGGATLPFAAIGAAVARETPSATSPGLVAMGIALHVAATFAWSAAFLWLASARGVRPMAAAFAIAVAAHVVSWVVAWSTGGGIASVLVLGDRLVLAMVFGITLVAGIRLALPTARSA